MKLRYSHSAQSLLKVLIPILVIAIFGAYNMIKMNQNEDSLAWQHYSAIVGLVVILILLFIKRYYAVLATGIFIVLSVINVISLSYGIVNVFFIGIPLGQPLGWLMLIVYCIFHLESLYNDYLDDKEKVNRK
jgi:uncharacterized membrane protein YhaH (DUF805 family)